MGVAVGVGGCRCSSGETQRNMKYPPDSTAEVRALDGAADIAVSRKLGPLQNGPTAERASHRPRRWSAPSRVRASAVRVPRGDQSAMEAKPLAST